MQIGILGLLGIVFIVLKLIGIVAWSWWLVLLPLYAGLAIFGAFMLIPVCMLIFGGMFTLVAIGCAKLFDK
jgi:hypothetical protein